METIRIIRGDNQDPMLAATAVAKEHDTHLEGNMRWHGLVAPNHREIGTADGRTIAVYEPGTPKSDLRRW